MSEQSVVDVTADHQRCEGMERWLRRVSPQVFISVLYRLTGFGWYEWETAIVFIRDDADPKKYARGTWDDREVLIIRGDRRDELATMPAEQLREWCNARISGNKNSFETLLDALMSGTMSAIDTIAEKAPTK